MQVLKIDGHLTVRLRDAVTNEILEERVGHNLILNAGLTSVLRLIVGDMELPGVISSPTAPYNLVIPVTNTGKKINSVLSDSPLPDIVRWAQFGTNATSTTPNWTGPAPDGSLGIPEANASPIVPITYSFLPSSDTRSEAFMQVSARLEPSQGNGPPEDGSLTYKEAVLLCLESPLPTLKYKIFNRRQFAGITKTAANALEADWVFSLRAEELN